MRILDSFLIPVYFIQGEEDLLAPKESTKSYFVKVSAPEKKYFLLPRTAHGFNQSVMDSLHEIVKGVNKIK